MRTLHCFEEACGFLVDSLKNCGYHVWRVEPYHFLEQKEKFVHAFLWTDHPSLGKEVHYMKYTVKPYFTFGREFPNTKAGFGESLNEEVYKYLAFFQTPKLLFFMYPNAGFMVDFKTFSHYCHRHATFRQQRGGECTVSCDVQYLHKMVEKTQWL
jgi:hypothetical protein